jgi:hypothetical protein
MTICKVAIAEKSRNFRITGFKFLFKNFSVGSAGVNTVCPVLCELGSKNIYEIFERNVTCHLQRNQKSSLKTLMLDAGGSPPCFWLFVRPFPEPVFRIIL